VFNEALHKLCRGNEISPEINVITKRIRALKIETEAAMKIYSTRE
jgi:hypothetical protein